MQFNEKIKPSLSFFYFYFFANGWVIYATITILKVQVV